MDQNINIAQISKTFTAYLNCKKGNNKEWEGKHEDKLNEIFNNLPSGSGIDSGIKFDWNKSKPEKLIFTFGYHHLNEGGFYDGWTDHTLVITPSFNSGYDIRITGKDRNMVKDYLYDLFNSIFTINYK